jgi:hypothetical protein
VAAAAAAITGGVPDAAIAQGPGAQLQRKMALYFRQWVALNLFLKDTMSPEQNFIMSMGCKWVYAAAGGARAHVLQIY